jgi:hypothetical protein
VAGFGTRVRAKVTTTAAPTAAVFNLAYRRQMPGLGGGQATVTVCSGCTVDWDLESSSGNPSVGSEGVYDSIATAGTYTVDQTLSTGRNYAEVGAVFTSVAGTLTHVGSFYSGGGSGTTKGNSSGTTDSGSATNGAAASSPFAWCSGADTLVLGISGRSTTTTDTMTSIRFGKNAPRMTRIQRQNGLTGDIYSEIWYAYNPNYQSATGATSSGTTVTVTSTTGLVVGTRVAVKRTVNTSAPSTEFKTFLGTGSISGNTLTITGRFRGYGLRRGVTFRARLERRRKSPTARISPQRDRYRGVPGPTRSAFRKRSRPARRFQGAPPSPPFRRAPRSPFRRRRPWPCRGTSSAAERAPSSIIWAPEAAATIRRFRWSSRRGTTQWAAGFTCIGGVDATNIKEITNISIKPTNWYEAF